VPLGDRADFAQVAVVLSVAVAEVPFDVSVTLSVQWYRTRVFAKVATVLPVELVLALFGVLWLGVSNWITNPPVATERGHKVRLGQPSVGRLGSCALDALRHDRLAQLELKPLVKTD